MSCRPSVRTADEGRAIDLYVSAKSIRISYYKFTLDAEIELNLTFFRGGDERLGVPKGGGTDALAGDHAGDFIRAGGFREGFDADRCPAAGCFLPDSRVPVGEGGDLGQVGYAENLV